VLDRATDASAVEVQFPVRDVGRFERETELLAPLTQVFLDCLLLRDLPQEIRIRGVQLGGAFRHPQLELRIQPATEASASQRARTSFARETFTACKSAMLGIAKAGATCCARRNAVGHGRQSRDSFCCAGGPVVGVPDIPDLHQVCSAAGDDEEGEAQEYPAEAKVLPLRKEVDQNPGMVKYARAISPSEMTWIRTRLFVQR
jgi:hypothetical protein